MSNFDVKNFDAYLNIHFYKMLAEIWAFKLKIISFGKTGKFKKGHLKRGCLRITRQALTFKKLTFQWFL